MNLFGRLYERWITLLSGGHRWPSVDIRLPGSRIVHLVGSIHMGTPDMAPLPEGLRHHIATADALFVEADIRTDTRAFTPSRCEQPLCERLSSVRYAQFEQRINELGLPLTSLAFQPAWHVALSLQACQAQQLGLRADYGIDYQMLQAAEATQTPVRELDGTQSQITLLETLPDGGIRLLDDTLEHWHTNARMIQLMTSWWMDAPPRKKNIVLPSTFSNELYDVLMHQRNQHWCETILALPPGRYVVAVGALHLYGEGNLPRLLKSR